MIAKTLDIHVITIDSSTLAPAKELKKLEILPPGHAAIRIIPSAILGSGFANTISKNVKEGNKIHWAHSPVISDLGDRKILRNRAFLRSNAIPNMIIARQTLRIQIDDLSKLSTT